NGKARPHSVPLTADIMAGLSPPPPFHGGGYLFFTTRGRSAGWISSPVKHTLDGPLLLPLPGVSVKRGGDTAQAKLPALVNHDPRRTLRYRLSELRVNADVAEAILAHVKPGIRGVYDRYEHFDEMRRALELWANHLKAITSLRSKAVSVRAAPLEGPESPRASFAERLVGARRWKQTRNCLPTVKKRPFNGRSIISASNAMN